MFKISVIGLGYVGLPLSVELSKFFKVVGFDVNISRVNNLKKGIDTNKDIKLKHLNLNKLTFSKYIFKKRRFSNSRIYCLSGFN